MEKMETAPRRFPDWGLYGFITEAFSRGRAAWETAEALGRAGVPIIQYREKDKSKKEKLAECRRIREITRRYGQCFIVNDDIDIALLADADGVHLGQDDIPAREARCLIGDRRFLGISTHSPEQLAQAIADGADYVGVGPIFPTTTKKDVCAAVGWEYLDHALANSTVPCVAIGGIKHRHLSELVARGTRLIALVTEILDSDDPETVARNLRETMRRSTILPDRPGLPGARLRSPET